KDIADRVLNLLALGQQLVERQAADHVAQRRLSVLRGREAVVLNLDHRTAGVFHLEEQRAVDLYRHVVLGDRALAGDVERQQARIDKQRAFQAGKDIEYAWP